MRKVSQTSEGSIFAHESIGYGSHSAQTMIIGRGADKCLVLPLSALGGLLLNYIDTKVSEVGDQGSRLCVDVKCVSGCENLLI